MSLGIDYFRAIQGGMGHTNIKDVKVAEIRRQFEKDFDTSIGVAHNTTRNNVPQDFIFTPTKDKNVCGIKPRPGEALNIGDIIYWNTLHWLVTDKNFQDEIYNSGTITRCNRTIRWQNPITLEIVERWCFCSKPYTSNIDEGNVISTLKGKYDIQLPYDSETIQVGVDKRLMLDIVGGKPMVYKLAFPDANTNKYQDIDGGFIEWTVVSDTYVQERDNVELMICDYIDPANSSKPPHHSIGDDLLECEIIGRNDIRVGGSPRNYIAKFYDVSGTTEIKDGVSPIWELIVPVGHEPYYKMYLSSNNFVATILAETNDNLVGDVVRLKLSDELKQYQSAEIEVEVITT